MKNYLLTLSLFVPLLCSSQDCTITYKALPDGRIAVLGNNQSIMPYSIKLNANLTGMKSSLPLPVIKVVEAKTIDTVAYFIPNKNVASGYKTSTATIEGNVLAKHNDHYIYQLPYKKEESFKIDQGYNGRSTHMGKNALDFHMDEGTEICAIRPGIVVQAVDEFKKGCPEESCGQFNNYVLVLHDDGSFADYSHLQKNGALVKVGDQVTAGQVIALSGKTGIASGPHLHLEVYTMGWNGQQSIPAKYEVNGQAIVPVEGMSYQKK